MNTVSVDLGRDIESIEIYTFSDWHIGDKHCDMSKINEQIKAVSEKENAFVICNGDLMNNATKTSVSDCYAEEIPPMEQLNKIVSLLSPIKDKILMITQGNHEARTYRTDGIDLTMLAANQLGILGRYAREGGILFLRFGKQSCGSKETSGSGNIRKMCYTIYVTHGSGGGRKEGAKAIRLADMASIVDTDIYIHSHTHLPMVMKESFYRIDVRNSTCARVDKLFVNTSAQLEYGGYGQTYEFKPSSLHNPVIYLNGAKKDFKARL